MPALRRRHLVLLAVGALALLTWLPTLRRGLEQTIAAHAPLPAGGLARAVTFRGVRYDVLDVPLDRYRLTLHYAPGGTRLSDAPGLARTNAGIFEPGFTPSGLLVSAGRELHPLERGGGEGNFFLRPNGVFLLTSVGAAIVETSAYSPEGVLEATQSGPLLLQHGQLHPAFREGSPNRAVRSAVGVADPRTVRLVISRGEVTLFDLATLFRDALGCPDALYLDGVISGQWVDGGSTADLSTGPFAGVLVVDPRP